MVMGIWFITFIDFNRFAIEYYILLDSQDIVFEVNYNSVTIHNVHTKNCFIHRVCILGDQTQVDQMLAYLPFPNTLSQWKLWVLSSVIEIDHSQMNPLTI